MLPGRGIDIAAGHTGNNRISKGVLLHCKRAPFCWQKDSFWSAKGVVLKCKRTPFKKSHVLSGIRKALCAHPTNIKKFFIQKVWKFRI